MKLIVGSKYMIVISVEGNILTFTCVIDDIDDHFVTFTDKYGKQFSYNLNTIISFKEVVDDKH